VAAAAGAAALCPKAIAVQSSVDSTKEQEKGLGFIESGVGGVVRATEYRQAEDTTSRRILSVGSSRSLFIELIMH
jgi:hypothetical protein